MYAIVVYNVRGKHNYYVTLTQIGTKTNIERVGPFNLFVYY